MLGTYGAAVLLFAAAAGAGAGLWALAGLTRFRAAAPAFGLALLIVVCDVAVRLPGDTVTAAVVAGLVAVALTVVAVRARVAARGELLGAVGLAAGGLLVASLPFIGRGRVGLLGVSLNNDTSAHLAWIQALSSDHIASLAPLPTGYPLGPHAVVGALIAATGAPAELVLTGFALCILPMLVLTAFAVLRHLGPWRRALAAFLTGFAYLVAAYYGQAAFKETMMALFIVAFVAGIEAFDDAPGWRRAALPAVPVAGALYTYSFQSLAWFAGLGGLVVAARLVAALVDGRRPLGAARSALAGVPVALVASAVLVVPELQRLINFKSETGVSAASSGAIAVDNVGNLAPGQPVSLWEALGLWPRGDYRFPLDDRFLAGQLSALALVLLLYGIGWFVVRRRFAPPAAVGACLVVYWLSRHTGQSIYVTAKALAILSPPAVLVISGALFAFPRAWAARTVTVAAAVVFTFYAVKSSELSLRFSPVAPRDQAEQLADLKPALKGGPVLFMANDDHIVSELPGVQVGSIYQGGYPTAIQIPPDATRGEVYGTPIDWDDFKASELDRFTYAITTRSGFASTAPPNWHRIRRTRLFELWRREGPTTPRRVFEPAAMPGGILACDRSAKARKLARTPGTAEVWRTPVIASGLAALGPGVATFTTLDLPRGRWTLSLQYIGIEGVDVTIGRTRYSLPANTARPGAFYELGTFDSPGGPQQVRIQAHQVNRLASPQDVTYPTTLVATQPDRTRRVPLSKACGRWVDWYTTDTPGTS